jgi:hypothetical protein
VSLKPIWVQPQDIGLRKALKPQQDSALSGVVVIYDGENHGYSYIRFPESAQKKLAKRMPMGIGSAEPAYIHVEHELDCYAVYCLYVYRKNGILLWREESLPKWVGHIKYAQI